MVLTELNNSSRRHFLVVCRGPPIISTIYWLIVTASFLLGSFASISTHNFLNKPIKLNHRKIIKQTIQPVKSKQENKNKHIYLYIVFLWKMHKRLKVSETEETPIIVPINSLHQKQHENKMHPSRVAYGRVAIDDHCQIMVSIVHQVWSIEQSHYQILCQLCMVPTTWCTTSL